MITVSKQENGVLFTFQDSDKYLYGSGTIEVPFNSLSIIQDESDNITLRKSASNDIFLSARYDTDFGYGSKEEAVEALKGMLYDEAGISEEEVQEMIDAATSGIPSSEVVEQLRRDVNAVSGEVDTKQDILTAGENITINGNVISADAGNNIIELTQAEYDALETKDPEALYIITDAQEINMNDYYTKSEVYNKQEVDTAYETAYQALTAHTADTNVHFTGTQKSHYDYLEGQYYVNDSWDIMPTSVFNDFSNEFTVAMGQFDQRITANASAVTELESTKLDASAYTPTDLSEYWTSAQTQTAINAATSGIPSSQVIEQLRTDLNTVSGDVADKQDALQYYSENTEEKIAEIIIRNDDGEGSTEDYHFNIGGGTAEIGIYNEYDDGQGNVTSNSTSIYADQTMVSLQAVTTEDGDTTSTIFSVETTGVTINGDRVLTEGDVDNALNSGSINPVQNGVITQALNNKLDASAYTPTDLSQYWTSGQTQEAINAATSGIPSSQVVEQLRTDINTVSGDIADKQDKLVFYSEAEYDEEAGTEATAQIYVLGQGDSSGNGAEVNVQPYTVALSASYEGEEPMSTTLIVTSDGVTINEERVLTEADLSAVTAVSNDLNTLSGAVIDNEYTVSQAINSLNNRVTAVESGGTGGGITSGEVQTMIDDSLDIYWTSAQTQTAIDGVKAYYVDFAAMSVQGITDADWDGLVAAINAHRPILVKVGTANGYVNATTAGIFDNTIIVTGADEGNASKYTFTKNGSNDYSVSTSTKKFVTQAEKDAWNAKQDELVSGTNIKTINNESILGSGNISLQEKLVSGTNIKTVNNQSILGSGNIDIQTGSSVTVDSALNSGSTNPVQNKAIAANIIDHYESANDIFGKPRYLKAITKSGGLSRPLSLYFSTINNKDIFANNGNNIIPTVNTFSLVETSAITTSMTSSSTDAQVPSAKAVYDQFGGLKLVKLTQAQYSAMEQAGTLDSNTLYIVTDVAS